jgi:hypothetical protein
MNLLIDAIGHHRVFEDFVEHPHERKALPSYWVYKIKHDGAGNVQPFKARLVVCGRNQHIEEIYYPATSASTAPFGHINLAPAIAGKYELEIHQMDACPAFLDVDLEEDINLHPPQGY